MVTEVAVPHLAVKLCKPELPARKPSLSGFQICLYFVSLTEDSQAGTGQVLLSLKLFLW